MNINDCALASNERARGGEAAHAVPESGIRRASRSAFTCPELFEQEFKYIWEKVWVYVAHESQIKAPRDFITTWIGRVPIVINRNAEGVIGSFVNICSHRGAILCRSTKGRAHDFTCPFHGWSFDLDGRLAAVMSEDGAGYPAGFDKSQLGLRKVKIQSYRGFLFATLNETPEPLEDHLGESKTFIDLLVDQAPEGIEILKGSSTYTYEGNWKLQAENGVDGYHVATVHRNYVATTKRRAKASTPGEKVKVMNIGDTGRSAGGGYDLGNGHTFVWSEWSNPADRPIFSQKEDLVRRIGEVKASWAIGRLRNLLVFPNVFFMDQMSSQIRIFRPISVNKTEVTIYCFGPVNEPAADRAKRIRQYEDFFNASGMATPDDLTEFEEAQKGCEHANIVPLSEMSRGSAHELHGGDAMADALGIRPALSSIKFEDEGILYSQHMHWRKLMAPVMQENK